MEEIEKIEEKIREMLKKCSKGKKEERGNRKG